MYKSMLQKMFHLMMSILMLFSIVTPVAFAQSKTTEAERQAVETAKLLYQQMTNDAKEIFASALVVDKQLLQFHSMHVSNNLDAYNNQLIAALDSANPLAILNAQLVRLKLPIAVRYSFMAIGSGLVAASADGPFPVGDVIGAVLASGGAIVLAFYWDEVASKWDRIVNAFKTAFTPIAYSIETELMKVGLDFRLVKFQSKVAESLRTTSARKHLESTLVERIQKLKPDEAYWGKGATGKQNVLMLVYKIDFNMWGKVARNLSTTQRYDANNGNAVNLNGYTAYLIYDVDKKQVFHAHIRRNTLAFANTEHLRYKNKLNWRVKPAPYLRDDKYLGVMPAQFLSGSPTLQFP